MIKKLHYIFLLLTICALHAQHPVYVQFSEKDDLPDIEFYNIEEDSKGFIWLAADKGFYRYDGNQFKIYTNKEKRGLSVFEPREDSKGRVWCCNISGQFFYVENDELITFIDLGQETNWKLGNFLVTDKHLLVFSLQTIYKISLETKEIEKRMAVPNNLVGQPCQYGDEIYIATGKSILTLDLELNINKKLTSEAIYNDLTNRSLGKAVIAIYKGRTYLKFTDRDDYTTNLYQFDLNTGQYEEIELEEELKKSVLFTLNFHNDEMLLSTSSGLWVYTLEAGKIVYKNRYFKDKNVSKVLVDSSENYWITTLRNGVFVIPNINNNSYSFPNDIQDFECIEKINENSFFFGTANAVDADYTLTVGSPAIDAGDNTYVTGTLDLVRNQRVSNTTVDIGAYEYAAAISIAPVVYLQGAMLSTSSTLMNDDLRTGNDIPTTSPYADSATCNNAVFTVAGNDAIVDWIWVELRDATTNTTVLDSQSALIQRDGDVVGVDGTSSLVFNQVGGNYYIVLKHRNHLGIMTANTINLSGTTTLVDFTDANNQITFGTNAQTIFGIPSGAVAMWAGNINGDDIVQYSGTTPDAPGILSEVLNASGNFLNFPTYVLDGYNAHDVNMDGNAQYTGTTPDTPFILQNVLAHPGNFLNFSTYQIQEQLPEN